MLKCIAASDTEKRKLQQKTVKLDKNGNTLSNE